VPWVPKSKIPVTLIEKLTMNSDHSLIAFALDIGNTEILTAGIKDMRSGRVYSEFKVENIS
jgi:protease II